MLRLYFQNIPTFCLSSLCWSFSLFPSPSVALSLGVPVVMVCAVGAAGMAITIHGSLAEACTQWSQMREGEGEGRSDEGGQKGTTERKNLNGVKEKGMNKEDGRRSGILFHAVITMKSFHSVCDDGGFLSSSYVKPLVGFDANIITYSLHFCSCDRIWMECVQTCLNPTELWVLKLAKDSWMWLYFIWKFNYNISYFIC